MQKISEWRKLPLSLTELCIDTTLRCGQSFRWRKISDEWHCVLKGRLISLKQDASHLHYRVTWPKSATLPITPPASVPPPDSNGTSTEDDDDTPALLHHYFALSQSVSTLYKQWAASDANFARRAPAFTGIRILNQDPWEALVAFICSSNNNISRISQMVQKLCLHYGPYVATVHGEAFHDFPTPDALAGDAVEARLRELGFGYRAKYIVSTARAVAFERPAGWLLRLRNPDCPAFGEAVSVVDPAEKPGDSTPPPTYRAAHDALLELAGVGPKVADCVCLMGLGWGEAVPIDTHVWQIAQRDYKLGGKASKTLTKAMYDAVGDHFRKLWGPQAGWAQSVLFTANLRSFAEQASSAAGAAAVTQADDEAATAAVAQTMTPQSDATTTVAADEGGEDGAMVARPASGNSRSNNKTASATRQTRKRTTVRDDTHEMGSSQGQAAEVGRVTRRSSKRLRRE